ncbi:PREDICTED: probable serine/threonine-protein kinase yakA, partial [Rhagoletis zephyria]|uniref:probable serine/threonine-protein kinase yakA n=1 Tax=Rhagoletis zephyria TaxID=28612 RepID=UPI0008112357
MSSADGAAGLSGESSGGILKINYGEPGGPETTVVANQPIAILENGRTLQIPPHLSINGINVEQLLMQANQQQQQHLHQIQQQPQLPPRSQQQQQQISQQLPQQQQQQQQQVHIQVADYSSLVNLSNSGPVPNNNNNNSNSVTAIQVQNSSALPAVLRRKTNPPVLLQQQQQQQHQQNAIKLMPTSQQQQLHLNSMSTTEVVRDLRMMAPAAVVPITSTLQTLQQVPPCQSPQNLEAENLIITSSSSLQQQQQQQQQQLLTSISSTANSMLGRGGGGGGGGGSDQNHGKGKSILLWLSRFYNKGLFESLNFEQIFDVPPLDPDATTSSAGDRTPIQMPSKKDHILAKSKQQQQQQQQQQNSPAVILNGGGNGAPQPPSTHPSTSSGSHSASNPTQQPNGGATPHDLLLK